MRSVIGDLAVPRSITETCVACPPFSETHYISPTSLLYFVVVFV